MMNKRGVKKIQATFQIINLVLSIVAIVFLTGMVNGLSIIESIKGMGIGDSITVSGETYTKMDIGGSFKWKVDSSGEMIHGPAMEAQIKSAESYSIKSGSVTKTYSASSGGGAAKSPPPATGVPAGYSTRGYAGEAYKHTIGGGQYAQPKGYEWVEGSWVKTDGLGASGGWGYSVTGIAQGAIWAISAYYIVQTIAPRFGLEDEQANAVSTAAAWGIFAGQGALSVFGKGGFGESWFSQVFGTQLTPGWATVGGIVVAAIIIYNMWEDEDFKTVTFDCDPWEPPIGGRYCEECNKQGILPCSEYQCQSLGQACQLLNPGTDEEMCTWVNRKDVNPPVLTPWEDALMPDYRYRPDKATSPPDKGAIIWSDKGEGGCTPAFTPLTFGIQTNEPAKCKIDALRKRTFDEMDYNFGGSSTYKYNHTQSIVLPSPESLEAENITIENDGKFELYVRCIDANGNSKPDSPSASFVFKYCVEEGPDTTPPLIVTTNLLNGMPVAQGTDSLDIELYINEPADCKWSYDNQPYDNMENDMSCSSSVFEMNAQMLYTCSTTLEGIKDEQDNYFYFRCQDKPTATEDRNTNTESYEFLVIGTRPLVIDSIEPEEEIIRDSTETVKVTLEIETIAGFNDGVSICYFSESCYEEQGDKNDFDMFLYDDANGSYTHSQDLWMPKGDYECNIKCIDLGGNSDYGISEFRVETDTEEPTVVRAFKDSSYLKIITDEEGDCVYSDFGCSYQFEEGTQMTAVKDINGDEIEHFTDWNTDIEFYIKCQDIYGNKPNPGQCSIVVRPFEIPEIV